MYSGVYSTQEHMVKTVESMKTQGLENNAHPSQMVHTCKERDNLPKEAPLKPLQRKIFTINGITETHGPTTHTSPLPGTVVRWYDRTGAKDNSPTTQILTPLQQSYFYWCLRQKNDGVICPVGRGVSIETDTNGSARVIIIKKYIYNFPIPVKQNA